jgi:hypothetical protein
VKRYSEALFLRRRERLVGRSDALRAALAADLEALRTPLAIAEGAASGLRYLRERPLLVGGLAFLLAAKRSSLWSWITHGIVLWQAFTSWRRRGRGG